LETPPSGRSVMLSQQRVAELVQQHAEEQRHYRDGGRERPDQATRRLVADETEEGQEQEEGPVDPHVYTRESSYLESTAHEVSPVRRRDRIASAVDQPNVKQ
jgi:hypothetical protein